MTRIQSNGSAPALFDAPGEMFTDALVSDCGRYRYALVREWDPSLTRVLFVMLNPSTADAREDDPTIRRCIGFAKRWGYGRLDVVNLFGWRATDPGKLPADCVRATGPDNDETIVRLADDAALVVAAWGAHDLAAARRSRVLGLLDAARPIYCLGKTKHGAPRHPLYVRADAELEVFVR